MDYRFESDKCNLLPQFKLSETIIIFEPVIPFKYFKSPNVRCIQLIYLALHATSLTAFVKYVSAYIRAVLK